MKGIKEVKRCRICDKPLRDYNKSGICSNCGLALAKGKKKEETRIKKRCIWCNTSLRSTNRTKICYECRIRNVWKLRYEELEKEFERHKKICERVLLSYHKKLRKYEPSINWDEEPE